MKIHDPEKDPKFYERYNRMIAYQFGREEITYEEVILMKRCSQEFC